MASLTKPKPHVGVVDHLVQLITATGSRHLRLPAEAPAAHPLDPLSPDEISQASAICNRHAADKGLPALRYNAITLQEPPKTLQLQFEAGLLTQPPPRQALCIIELPNLFQVAQVLVNLGTPGSVALWQQAEGIQPMVSADDTEEAEEIVANDPGVRKILRERYGITDMSMVAADPWYYGDRYVSDPSLKGRFIQCFMYMRNAPQDNHYAHPLDLVVNLELHSRRVLDCFMHDRPFAIPPTNANFVASLAQQERPWRTGLRPLNISQPEGPSFEVAGNAISWQKWNMRISFNYREGLVLHHVGYEDQGRVRPIMHRGSLVEIIVPYGDPRHPFEKKCAYDIVDYGLGFTSNSLELGCDCLGHIQYFDAVLNNSKGEPWIIKKAVCMHEEDHGLLWKHVEYRTGHSESRRSRRLVLSFIATVANYEYGFYWYFYQDGGIQYEVKLTGCLSTNGLSAGEGPEPTHGTLLAPGLNAQVHQHFFCARLDMAVDDPQGGAAITVTEVNVESDPEGPLNPYGVGFSAHETELQTELAARRRVDPSKSRVWKIKNYNSRNSMTGAPVSYKLVPAPSPPLYALPTSSHARRGIFATRNLWVTPHSEDESYPAGFHPLQAHGADGLEQWTSLDRNIANADCVIWHAFGVTHIPRIEDWPVMPVETTGFWLKPVNFFDANPGLDIPPEKNGASREVKVQGQQSGVYRQPTAAASSDCNHCNKEETCCNTSGPAPKATSKM
ncbi:hypothetical protein WJX73_003875 [Symbiochloris irregularis]|uniref:Amine oxidase n=1 Tax=Symbiochloris irregularis TaxID=706552 RepID=A0AAW1P131_9CHLO